MTLQAQRLHCRHAGASAKSTAGPQSHSSVEGAVTPLINCRQGSKAIADGLGCWQPRRIGKWRALKGATTSS
eukprot:1873901-Alexandrium_andersonii.AAC.1